ncbi:hypothetical protein EBR57_05480, partial [bacterium]|nr:hypothetical protein [bacterium]
MDAMEDDDEECDSEDEQTFMKESYEKVETVSAPQTTSTTSTANKKNQVDTDAKVDDDEETDEDETLDVDAEYKELLDLKKLLAQKLARTPSSTRLQKAIDECNESIRDLIKRGRAKNAKKYYGLVQDSAQQDMSEIHYFKKKMSNQEQLKIM